MEEDLVGPGSEVRVGAAAVEDHLEVPAHQLPAEEEIRRARRVVFAGDRIEAVVSVWVSREGRKEGEDGVLTVARGGTWGSR